jgi:hypothetical protein
MKHIQRHLRAEFQSLIPSYARRRRTVCARNPNTYPASHPECKTALSCTNGAHSYLRYLPFLSATRDRWRAAQGRTRGHNHKKATMAIATSEQAIHVEGATQLEAHNLLQIMSPRKDKLNSRQYPCRCSPQCRILLSRRGITRASILTPSRLCQHPSRYG